MAPSNSISNRSGGGASPLTREELARFLATGPVFDAHADSIGLACDLGIDLAEESPGHLDLMRGKAGGLGAWVVVCWVDPESHLERAAARVDEMMDAADDLAQRRPDRFRLVGDGAEFARARSEGVVAGVLGIEGGHGIEGSLETLERFVARGLRLMTLVWNNHLPWIRSCQAGAGDDIPLGLSAFGRAVVRRMNQLGVVVDLSHAGERSFYDALETTDKPVLASHSGCYALHDHPRNLKDAQLRALRDNGGVCGIVPHPGFLSKEARQEQARVRASAEWQALRADNPAALFVAQQKMMLRDMRPYPLDGLIDHIEHAVKVAGVEHVGIGTDFDGIECGPQGLEHAGRYGSIAEKLHSRGFALTDIDLILGRNVQRVFSACTQGHPLH
ncbi:MAG: membrane dipeptidase [Planctomycetota bacterium]|jgi:membrane dipeptidase